jgi:hypothetical protein
MKRTLEMTMTRSLSGLDWTADRKIFQRKYLGDDHDPLSAGDWIGLDSG